MLKNWMTKKPSERKKYALPTNMDTSHIIWINSKAWSNQYTFPHLLLAFIFYPFYFSVFGTTLASENIKICPYSSNKSSGSCTRGQRTSETSDTSWQHRESSTSQLKEANAINLPACPPTLMSVITTFGHYVNSIRCVRLF